MSERKAQLDALLLKFGVEDFEDYKLINKALTHTSYSYEHNLPYSESYERLEFLGDAVLKLNVSKIMYDIFPKYSEGQMTKIRSIVVSDKHLAKVAKELELGKFINLGKQEKKAGGQHKQSILACAFEALLGAFYLGEKDMYVILKNLLEGDIRNIDRTADKHNYKAMLQEYTQSINGELPEYKLISSEGPAHQKLFTVEVLVDGKSFGIGEGISKKQAEKEAAKMAMDKLSKD